MKNQHKALLTLQGKERTLSKKYSQAFRDWQAELEESWDILLALFAMPVCCSFRALHQSAEQTLPEQEPLVCSLRESNGSINQFPLPTPPLYSL